MAHEVRPFLYDEGPRSAELDAIAVAKRGFSTTDSEVSNQTPGVKQVSKETSVVHTVRGHHTLVRFNITKVGDIEYLKVIANGSSRRLPLLDHLEQNRNNVHRRNGRLVLDGESYTVKLEMTPNVNWFYIYLPQKDLTEGKIDSWEAICTEKAQKVANFIQKHGGWQFGLMEFCKNFKPEFGGTDPRYLKNLVSRQTARSSDGETYLSDSQGRYELETTNPELAKIIVDLPGSVHRLIVRLNVLDEILDRIIADQEKLAQMQLSELEKQTVEHLAHANGNGGGH